MILTLELSAPQKSNPGVRARQTFNEDGGTIGRDGRSSWVLPDGEVSSRHARISYRNGSFYIEDTNSTNGVSINSAENRLLPSRRYPLKTGDRIFIRPYVIAATISSAAEDAVEGPFGAAIVSPTPRYADSFAEPDAFYNDDPFASRDLQPPSGSPFPPPSVADAAPELNPLNLLGAPPKRAATRKSTDSPGSGSLLESHYRPPDAVSALPDPQAAGDPIPRDYNPLRDDSAMDSPPQPPPSRPSPPAAVSTPPFGVAAPPLPREPIVRPVKTPITDDPAPVPTGNVRALDLRAFLEGAGLDGSLVGADLERTFGEILRVVVAGVMEVLRARQQIKDEFRIQLTQFRPAENNPLKFSANVEDALHNLLVKRNPAYLEPVQAFTEAFQDLRHHQIAMLEGMRAAFDAMLEEFDPDALQKEFDRQLKTGVLLSAPAKLRYWDLYRERCRTMLQDKEATFRKLFGEEFAEAYEVQLRRLKAAGRRPESTAAPEGPRPSND